jgi:small ligand-binding sensory domain FIST
VGVLLDADASPRCVVSQGCRPVGQPFTVTQAERNMLYELAGRPALERLLEMVDQLPPSERALAARGLHCGVVIDEHKLDFRRGDFLIRGVLGADRSAGAVAVGDAVPVGATVQFQVRDAASADEDLCELLAGQEADGALVFTCNGRGRQLFGQPDHDAAAVARSLDTAAVAGMFCAGEVGPIGGHNHLHGFTASMALFCD